MTVKELIAQARQAGFTLVSATDGTLRVRGPRSHGQLAQALIERKTEVLTELGADPRQFIIDVVAPERGYTTAPCPVCGFPTVIRDCDPPESATVCTRCRAQAIAGAYRDWAQR